MYVLIDWGNTRLKYLIVEQLDQLITDEQGQVVQTADSVNDLTTYLSEIAENTPITHILIASVRSKQDNLLLFKALQKIQLVYFEATTNIDAGIVCAYRKPQQLGIDRWLAIIAGYRDGQVVGVIDIGSAITLDIVDSNGRHLGGQILPGERLLRDSLLSTAKVKAKHRPLSQIFQLGQSTDECVNFGIEQMIFGYLTRSIDQAEKKYQVNRWIITGGDGNGWFERLVEDIPATSNRRYWLNSLLVFQGLAKLYRQSSPK